MSGCFTEAIDFTKTLAVYNLCYWFDGVKGYILLDNNAIAVVDVSGCFKIYAPSCEEDYVKKLRWVLGLDENLDEFFEIASNDKLLKGFAKEFRGWRHRASDLWWALIVAHCQRNASFKQGWRILHRIVKNYGKYIEIEGKKVLLPPKPEDILENPSKLVESGAGFRVGAIIEAAKAFKERRIDVEKLQMLDDETVEDVLENLPQVGSYVARLAMVLGLRRYSLPPVDRWTVAIVSKVYGVNNNAKDVELFLRRRWGRWAGLAVLALTITLDAEPLRKALDRIDKGFLTPRKDVSPSPLNMAPFCSE